MKYVRVGAVGAPEKGRVNWAREALAEAMQLSLAPALVPLHQVESFTVSLPDHLAVWLEQMAIENDMSVSEVSARLIQALENRRKDSAKAPAEKEDQPTSGRISMVRAELRSLTEETESLCKQGRIVFFEAATGTGKGRAIMYLATQALEEGKRVLVSAPLAIVRQLVDESAPFIATLNIRPSMSVVLGRANFIDPAEARAWATEMSCTALLEWLDAGAQPQSVSARGLSKLMGVKLCYLIEEALEIAEDLPVSAVMLDSDAHPACPANEVYQSLKARAEHAELTFCSHHFLAADQRQRQIGMPGALADQFDLMLIDEAHLLESAFGAINSQQLHLNALRKHLSSSKARGKGGAIDALEALSERIRHHVSRSDRGRVQRAMADLPDIASLCSDLEKALSDLKVPKVELAEYPSLGRALTRARLALGNASSGRGVGRLELTPIKNHSVMTVGQATLIAPMTALWERAGAVALVSATLYTDGETAKLMRWKLNVPQERAAYPPPVRPRWLIEPVTYHSDRVDLAPEECALWHDLLASKIEQIVASARGGTLVLVTAYATAEALEDRLRPLYGRRLLVQGPNLSTSAAVQKFRLYKGKPIWIGVGAAWTGVDLSNPDVAADQDLTLSDLIVARLPFGINKTLTHHRRVEQAGPGGPGVEMNEALWMLRQGIGRLVRRKGSAPKNLWVLDNRMDTGTAYYASFRKVLAAYHGIK